MTPEQFHKQIEKLDVDIQYLIYRKLPIKVGTAAVSHFKQNFEKEGFVNNGLQKWEEVERRKPESEWYGFKLDVKNQFSTTNAKNEILHESGFLQKSIKKVPGNAEVKIINDAPYAAVHNEGLPAKVFGKKEFQMPKRQFIGNSAELDEKVKKIIEQEIKKILKF